MGQQASAISKEAIWRDHLIRHAASGKTIAAFCRDEAIAEGNFYAWRTRLRQDTANMAQKASTSAPKQVAPFIDLGPVKSRAVDLDAANWDHQVHVDFPASDEYVLGWKSIPDTPLTHSDFKRGLKLSFNGNRRFFTHFVHDPLHRRNNGFRFIYLDIVARILDDSMLAHRRPRRFFIMQGSPG